jgi:hypothetical protein
MFTERVVKSVVQSYPTSAAKVRYKLDIACGNNP